MKRETSIRIVLVIPIVIVLLSIGTMVTAQAPPPFRNHEVIDAGNGMKVEILSCRGTGENEECDVIYYTEKRYLGKRVWEKSKVLKDLKLAARMEQYNKSKGLSGNNTTPKSTTLQPYISKPATNNTTTKFDTVTKAPVVNTNKTTVKILKDTVAKVQEKKGNVPPPLLKNSTETKIAEVSKPAKVVVKPQTYTLANIYALAKERNLSMRQAQNTVDNFEIDRKIAIGQYLPSASYNIGHYFSRGKNIDPVTNTFSYSNFSGGYTALGLQLDIFSGFRRLNTVKQTGYSIKAAEFARKKLEIDLLSSITLAYARLLLDKEQLAIQQNLIASTTREIEVVNEKIKVGRLSKYEFYTFNSRLNTQQANLVTLQNDSMAAVIELKTLLNLPQSDAMDVSPIDTSFMAEIYSTDIAIPEFLTLVLKQHPAIRQAEMEAEVAKLGEKISQSSYYPSLSLGGNLSSNYNANQVSINGSKVPLTTQLSDNIGQNLNLNLRVPIFSQNENMNRVKKEKINIYNAQLGLQAATNTITSNTLQLVNDFNAAKKKFQATKSAWEQNKLSYDLYTEKYRVGQISSVELLTMQDNLNTSTSSYMQTRLQMLFQYQLLELLKNYN